MQRVISAKKQPISSGVVFGPVQQQLTAAPIFVVRQPLGVPDFNLGPGTWVTFRGPPPPVAQKSRPPSFFLLADSPVNYDLDRGSIFNFVAPPFPGQFQFTYAVFISADGLTDYGLDPGSIDSFLGPPEPVPQQSVPPCWYFLAPSLIDHDLAPGKVMVNGRAQYATAVANFQLPRAILVEQLRMPPPEGQVLRVYVAFRALAPILITSEEDDVIVVTPGATSKSLPVFIRDSQTGQGKTGLSASSTGAQAAYVRSRGTPVNFTLTALGAVTDSWTSGGFIEEDATKMPGSYRLDVPDAAIASGVDFVQFEISFSSTLNALHQPVTVQLVNTATSAVGAGSIAYVVTVTNSATTFPVANAEVWVSTDSAGLNVVAGTLVTDMNGQVTFYLDAGSYYLWCTEPGFTRSNPTSITVS